MEGATGIAPPSHFVSKIAGSLPEPEDWGQVCPGALFRRSNQSRHQQTIGLRTHLFVRDGDPMKTKKLEKGPTVPEPGACIMYLLFDAS